MRIAYGVHGYGQGHATRSMAVLPALREKHDVLVFAGGDAYKALHQEHPTVAIPALGYHYRADGTRSDWLTIRRTLPVMQDLCWRGSTFKMIEGLLRDFAPDVIIADAEIWTHWVGRYLRIPRISFDHFGIMAWFNPPMRRVDRLLKLRDVWIYKTLIRDPERVLVSSFYDAEPTRSGVRLVGTLLRDEVRELSPTQGDHILVYLNNGRHLYTDQMEAVFKAIGVPMCIYGTGRVGTDGLLEYRPRGNRAFLEALASCRAVISTAGNQLVGEAIHFRKPMLVMPEDCVEQRINGMAVERMGLGMKTSAGDLNAAFVRTFLSRCDRFAEQMARCDRDGATEAVAALEGFFAEFADQSDDRQERRSVA